MYAPAPNGRNQRLNFVANSPILAAMDKSFSHSLKNQFLIAMPHMQGSGFASTVTYLCEHDEQGAMGLVINRPTGLPLSEIFEQLKIGSEESAHGLDPIYAGGPVQTDRGFILHASNKRWNSTIDITDQISLTTSKDILASIAQDEGPEDCLVALGYAGWGAGQLEREISDNFWLTAPANTDIIFHTPTEERLQAAADLLGINLERISPLSGHA